MTAQSTATNTRRIMALFFLQPIALGGWFAQIPAIQDKLGLTNAELALALLGLPAAFVLVSKLAASVIGKHGAPVIFKTVFPLQAAAVLLPLTAPSQWTLLAALFVFGVAAAFLSVALNVYAGQVEKSVKTSVMNRCHGFWALGLMGGSLLTSLTFLPISPTATLLCQASLSALIGVFIARGLIEFRRTTDTPHENAPTVRRKLSDYPVALFLIALFVVSVTMTEGTLNNWAAVYMSERLAEGSAQAGLAVTVYSGFLALGRFLGDALKTRLGGARLARLTVGVAILGLLILIAPLPIWMAFVGFALAGLGVSVGFPLAVSAVAELDDRHEADNIAFLSIVAVSGSVIAPPVIGVLADSFGMERALAALLPGLIASFVLANHLTGTRTQDAILHRDAA